MTPNDILLDRNRDFAEGFAHADMPPLPRLGTLILTCIDARVDPAHTLGLGLGDAVVFRNNGGRVTQAFIDEVATLALMVARMTDQPEAGLNIVLMQHTKCGAQSLADPAFRARILESIGVDVSESAITDPESDLTTDIARLRDAPGLPDGTNVSAMLYDVETGQLRQIAPARSLADLRG
ncbi:carbonic anhydrase [Aestuariicoccus sp. MJ-SS9]|uniref:carbonic anhydrase n=1 Tax=Aestuariicoccus sp. MJ-SS9 TaxID=3079855 RepID=UPI002910CB0E|nr:carbonic anhydrase [Aestuariicoccus sp. MJ-SS9]MDU8913178.1 carbonic anhydrase [Aestuariicoccus sp. MJ-SS9]